MHTVCEYMLVTFAVKQMLAYRQSHFVQSLWVQQKYM